MYHCIYQILHNEIKQLKIKRKSKHKGKQKSFSNGLLVCSVWPSLPSCPAGGSLRESQLGGPVLPSLSNTGPQSSSLSTRRMIFSTTFNCSFCFFPLPEVYYELLAGLLSWYQSSPCLTSILCLDCNCNLLPTDNCLLWVSCWSNSLLNQIKSFKHKLQSFLLIAPSYSKGFHFPLTSAHHPPGENTGTFFCTCLWCG